ncbi:uncharacterized protein LOC126774259 [Nymphalis io]|uniref:uncharacterized protein LOC126774259 n=1 Tax=Inachis io TaxID=171585 RepID=UPI0021682F7E|nr:uncharacterized protein LOC126774259 [Nymphalis io]
MSELFHKSCYTSRSTGYKYRTLSTNTGEKKRRESKEDSTFDRKFKELKGEIGSRIMKEVDEVQRARQSIQDKFEKIDAKINSMLNIQTTITLLRNDLRQAENILVDTIEKVEKMEGIIGESEASSLQSRSSYCKPQQSIVTKKESVSLRIT